MVVERQTYAFNEVTSAHPVYYNLLNKLNSHLLQVLKLTMGNFDWKLLPDIFFNGNTRGGQFNFEEDFLEMIGQKCPSLRELEMQNNWSLPAKSIVKLLDECSLLKGFKWEFLEGGWIFTEALIFSWFCSCDILTVVPSGWNMRDDFFTELFQCSKFKDIKTLVITNENVDGTMHPPEILYVIGVCPSHIIINLKLSHSVLIDNFDFSDETGDYLFEEFEQVIKSGRVHLI
jgi:hypothetical protein